MEANKVVNNVEQNKSSKKLKTLDSYTGKLKLLEVSAWLLLILYMTPFYLMFINSFKTRREIFANTTGLPDTWNFKNYLDAMKRMDMISSFTNSMIITVGSVALIILFSSMAAWVLVRNKTKKSKILFYVFTSGMIVPFQAVMIPLVQWMAKIQIGPIKMLGTHYGLIFMYIGFGVSMSIFLYHGFIKGIPEEIEEAATIDGCSRWQTFMRIIIPLLKPTTVTVAVLNSIWVWNDFLLPFLTVN